MRNLRFIGMLAMVVLASCSSGGGDNNSSTGIVAHIKAVQTSDGILGSLHTGSPPSGGGATVTAPEFLSVVNGGTGSVPITSSADFVHVAVAVSGDDGYYDVVFPADPTSTDLLITMQQNVDVKSLTLQVSVAGADGKFGATSNVQATVTSVGSGDVQVSLSWDTPSDLDLHVVGPDSSEIYYGNRTSPSGGQLDLDSNPACDIDGINNENVTWPTGRAPSGTYIVRVDDFDGCNTQTTHYVVTVTVAGKSPQVFQGTFTGPGDQGGIGSGTLVTTFTK